MLVQIECPPSGRSSAVPSIMDSPTLARVERAMLRHEMHNQDGSVNSNHQHNREVAANHRTALAQSLIPSNFGKETGYHAIKRGLLWQQRDRLFSRWKERYFVLTRDYLHCFRRASGTDRISEMGQFLFKIKLVDVDKVEWVNKKTYSTVSLELGRDGKVLLRAPDGLEDWFELLEECMLTSKERRRALKFSHEVGGKRDNNNSINSSLEEWLAARQKIPNVRALSTDTVSTARGGSSEESVRRRDRKWDPRIEDPDTWTLQDSADNRLSLLTDIDISSYDGTLEASSVASYRHSEDVYCVSRNGRSERHTAQGLDSEASSLRASFRSATPEIKRNGGYIQQEQPQLIKFRERSHSDIQRIDRRPWRLRAEVERRAIYN